MAAKRHMDIKRNITGHNMIIADMTGYSLKQWCLRRPGRLVPNSIERETGDKIEKDCPPQRWKQSLMGKRHFAPKPYYELSLDRLASQDPLLLNQHLCLLECCEDLAVR